MADLPGTYIGPVVSQDEYYDSMIAAAVSNYNKYIQILLDYRQDILILLNQKEIIMSMALAINQNEYSFTTIKTNSDNIIELPGDYVPKMKELFDQTDIKQHIVKTNSINSDYYSDLEDLLAEIDEKLDTYADEIASIKSTAKQYGDEANSWAVKKYQSKGELHLYDPVCDTSEYYFKTLIVEIK